VDAEVVVREIVKLPRSLESSRGTAALINNTQQELEGAPTQNEQSVNLIEKPCQFINTLRSEIHTTGCNVNLEMHWGVVQGSRIRCSISEDDNQSCNRNPDHNRWEILCAGSELSTKDLHGRLKEDKLEETQGKRTVYCQQDAFSRHQEPSF